MSCPKSQAGKSGWGGEREGGRGDRARSNVGAVDLFLAASFGTWALDGHPEEMPEGMAMSWEGRTGRSRVSAAWQLQEEVVALQIPAEPVVLGESDGALGRGTL